MGPVGAAGCGARAMGLGVAPLGAPFGFGSLHPYPVAGRGAALALALGDGVAGAPEEAPADDEEADGACAAAIGAADKTRTVRTTERQGRCARMSQVEHAPKEEGNSPPKGQNVVLNAARMAPFDGLSKAETAPASGMIPETRNMADGVIWKRTSGSTTRRGSLMPVFWVMGTLP